MELASVYLVTVLCLSLVSGYEDVTVAEYFHGTNSYTFFTNLMAQAQLTDKLSESGPFTVFVPVDKAFMDLGEDTFNQYSNAQLQALVEYHIVEGYVLVATVNAPANYTTLLGRPVTVEPIEKSLLVNNKSSVDLDNTDNIVRNGIIQPVDLILTPPGNVLNTMNIGQVLLNADSLFYIMCTLSGMDTLLESGDYTMFVPTATAFVEYEGNLLSPSLPDYEETYRQVIRNHLIPGGRRLSQLGNGTLTTLHGTTLEFVRGATGVTVNGLPLSYTEAFATNGMLHPIDGFLIPADMDELNRK